MSKSSAQLVCAYLRNWQVAQANGQTDHADYLFTQALELLKRGECSLGDGMPLHFSIGVGLDTGLRRYNNEDFTWAEQFLRALPDGGQETVGLFVVADGMGGHAQGQEASREAVRAFVNYVYPRLLESDVRGADLKALLVEGVREADRAVYLYGKDILAPGESMGTTFTAAVAVGTEVFITSTGDSRCYIFRPGCGLTQLTCDHSEVAQLLATGAIEPEEVYTHPRRNIIYRALGTDESGQEIDEPVSVSLQDGDILLLCSDGMWEMVPDPSAAAMIKILSDPNAEAQEMAEALIELALNGGGKDNVGLIVAQAHVMIADAPTLILAPLSESQPEETLRLITSA